MKINASNLFYFVNSINLLALAQLSKTTNTIPDNIFENASNKTLVLKQESANAAFCEYDVCHTVLEPTQKQWIAYSKDNGSEVLTYDICDTAGPEAIVYNRGKPECVSSSGARINITSTINNVTASGNEYVKNIFVNKVMENQTDSDACLEVYDVHFSLENVPTYSPTSLPELNLNNITTLHTEDNSLTPSQLTCTIFFCALAVMSLCLLLRQNNCTSNKKEPLLGNESVGKTYGGLFSHFYLREQEDIAQKRSTSSHSMVEC